MKSKQLIGMMHSQIAMMQMSSLIPFIPSLLKSLTNMFPYLRNYPRKKLNSTLIPGLRRQPLKNLFKKKIGCLKNT
jgi:hypothetical protein